MDDGQRGTHQDYVLRLASSGAIQSPAVEAAFRRVPRHRLIEAFYAGRYTEEGLVVVDPEKPTGDQQAAIYGDGALVTRVKDGRPASSSSAPALVACMLELLELERGHAVLEIGAGTGYNAALLAEVVGDQRRIVSVEYQDDVAAQTQRLLRRAGYADILVVCGDGFYGYEERAPFDRVVVTVGCPDVSPHWLAQLAPRGFVLVPLRLLIMNPLVRVWTDDDGVRGRVVGLSGFMMMEGELYDASYWPSTPPPEHAGEGSEEPIWENFAWRPQRGEAWVDSEWGGFWYFVATRDQRAWMPNWLGFGLRDGRGSVVISEGVIRTAGSGDLRGDLDRLHDEWHKLGRPRPSQYSLRFVAVNSATPDVPEGAWSVDRRFFRQFTWVERRSGSST